MHQCSSHLNNLLPLATRHWGVKKQFESLSANSTPDKTAERISIRVEILAHRGVTLWISFYLHFSCLIVVILPRPEGLGTTQKVDMTSRFNPLVQKQTPQTHATQGVRRALRRCVLRSTANRHPCLSPSWRVGEGRGCGWVCNPRPSPQGHRIRSRRVMSLACVSVSTLPRKFSHRLNLCL